MADLTSTAPPAVYGLANPTTPKTYTDPVFNTNAYLTAHPEVAQALKDNAFQGHSIDFTTAEQHYNQYGKAAGYTTPIGNYSEDGLGGAYASASPTTTPTPQSTTQAQSTYTPQTYTPIVSTPQTQQDPISIYDPTNDIKALGESQKAAALAGLQKAHDQNTSDLSTAAGKIEPQYLTQRNAASTDNQVAARNFAEYMAQRGDNNQGGNNGTMDQSNIASNMSLQGNLGSLAKGEAGAYADNAKQVGDMNVAYNNDVASSNASIDASNMQSLISAQQQYNAAKLAQSNTDRTYNYQVGRDTTADANTNWQNQNTVNNENQDQANNVWTQNNTINQQAVDQANIDKNYNYQVGRDAVVDTGKTADGTETMAGQEQSASIKNQNLQSAYQALVNAGYPAEQAAKMTGLNLANAGQSLTNQISALTLKYQPQILAGQVTQQNLANAYQTLVNKGYSATQASTLAYQAAETRAVNRSNIGTSGGGVGSSSSGKSSAKTSAKKKTTTTKKSTSSSKSSGSNNQQAIQSALSSTNLAQWVNDNKKNMETLTARQKAALMPGGSTYHAILKGD
jgi:hypothetical protein